MPTTTTNQMRIGKPERNLAIVQCRESLRRFAAARGYDWTHVFTKYLGVLGHRAGGDVAARRAIYAQGRALGYSYPVIGSACGVPHSTVLTTLRGPKPGRDARGVEVTSDGGQYCAVRPNAIRKHTGLGASKRAAMKDLLEREAKDLGT